MMPDIIPQETWKKADEFFDALANGTTDAQQLAAKDVEIAALQARCEAMAGALGEAIVWDGYDEDGVPAVWLDQADAALLQHKGDA
jgi:hypothetical protein